MKQVLVVDDLPEVRLVLKFVIESPGVEVVEAEDGLQALEVLKNGCVDLIITDCKMPRMSGLQLIEEARAQHPDLAFIVVSSTAKEEDFRHLKPYAIMEKPFKLVELKAAVDGALSDTGPR